MKIALVGYGKMGKAIEQIAVERGHTICCKATAELPLTAVSEELLLSASAFIDFSSPTAILKNIEQLAKIGKPLIIGTTGWYDKLDWAKDLSIQYHVPILYSPNFSIGVNLFLHLVACASKLIDQYEDYDVSGLEMHHNKKEDSPSGTAQAMAARILQNSSRKKETLYHPINRAVLPHELHISSLRCGSIPGHHEVIFDSPVDTISISHQARNRHGLARGAVIAAEWLQGQPPGLYRIEDMLVL